MTTSSSLAELRKPKAENELSNERMDLFTLGGFALAQRIATAFSTSNAVPAAFRQFVEKKVNGQIQYVENPNALGNCLVAYEVAQSVGMSVTAVMQNADVIDGKLRWSGKFVIAAINASRRFSPLRFEVRNLGPIQAKYKEKTGWNQQMHRYDFEERTITVDNKECIAWALPAGIGLPQGIRTLEQARAAGVPVIESVPVSIKMAVEEGWYTKSGSKWQTMPDLMLQYRAGTFFGNIHAPDVVMGMGRTAEEERDTIEVFQQPDGTYSLQSQDLKKEAAATQVVVQAEVFDSESPALNKAETQPTIQTPDETSDWVSAMEQAEEPGLAQQNTQGQAQSMPGPTQTRTAKRPSFE